MNETNTLRSRSPHVIPPTSLPQSAESTQQTGTWCGRCVKEINWKGYFLLGTHFFYGCAYLYISEYALKDCDEKKCSDKNKATAAITGLFAFVHFTTYLCVQCMFTPLESLSSQKREIHHKKNNEALFFWHVPTGFTALLFGSLLLWDPASLDYERTIGKAISGMGAVGSLSVFCLGQADIYH